MSGDDGPIGRREVAYRLFASEYDDADLEYSDPEEERAPNYVVTPTGGRVNRLFVVGVLTEVEPVSDEVLRARVVDPTGAFVAYAGQYQPEAVAFLEEADVPSFVSLTGKARTFQPDGSDRVFTSVRPESITTVDSPTRDRWTAQAAEHTLARVATMARALERDERGDSLADALRDAGVSPGLASGVALAIDHYGTSAAYLSALREQAVAAAELVAGGWEGVPDLGLAPDDDGPIEGDLTAAPAVTGTLAADAEIGGQAAVAEAGSAEPDTEPGPEPEPADSEPTSEPPGQAAEDPDPTSEEGAIDPEEAVADTSGGERVPADDELGEFEAPEAATGEGEPAVGQYEMDESEREEVEAEFGTEFSTGSEVAEPGEAGIEPETESPAAGADTGAPADDEPAADPDATQVDDREPAADEEPAAELDLEDAAVEAMTTLDEGDGAARDAVVDSIVESRGVDPEAVEAAIDEALMGGRCYEPSDGTLKAI